MSDTQFPLFETTDLAHADVFNEKVRTPGEAARTSLNQHRADETNPHNTSWDQVGGAPSPHGNDHHDPNFATEGHNHDGTYAPNPHDNTAHDPNFAQDPHGNDAHSPNMVERTGDTMSGVLVAQNNTSYTTFQVRNIYLSTADPDSGLGANGDIWLKYEA